MQTIIRPPTAFRFRPAFGRVLASEGRSSPREALSKAEPGRRLNYRPEIDGLRALAVIPVILFHAGFDVAKGGFVGVDIFFVISGYLISSIIMDESRAGCFSIVNFYERRVRRIIPALLFMLTACLPAAWLLLTPQEMAGFAKSLISVCLFSSNIYFSETSGYFDSASELKPLLHTWSLAVEEQFYLFFPFLLTLLLRKGERRALQVLIALTLASILFANWALSRYPSAAFYLLPTRAWELFIGSFAAFYLDGSPRRGRIADEAFGAAGLVLILYAILAFDRQTPFPGFYALAPTLGAALIIIFARGDTLVGKLLGAKSIVTIGLLSYSAYLWHQPLLAFARNIQFGGLTTSAAAGVVLGTFPIAYFSWRVVERPFRTGRFLSRPEIFAVSFAAGLLLLFFGVAGVMHKGFEGRYDEARRDFLGHFENSAPDWRYFTSQNIPAEFRLQCDFYDFDSHRAGLITTVPKTAIAKECYERNPIFPKAVFIWGDSHAQQLHPGLKRVLPADWQILQVASSGCSPAIAEKGGATHYCEQSNWFALEQIAKSKPDVVIVAHNAVHPPETMSALSDHLKKLGARKVIFMGSVPHWKYPLPVIVATKLWPGVPKFSALESDDKFKLYDKYLKDRLGAGVGFVYLSAIDAFCRDSGCLIYVGDDPKSGLTAADDAHLTIAASEYLARQVLAPAVVAPQ